MQRQLLWTVGLAAAAMVTALWAKEGCDAPTYPTRMDTGGPFTCAEYWVNRYQTLIGAVATLLAAAVAFLAVRRQVNASERIERYRLSQEATAARSVLPFALDAITEYAERGMRELGRHHADPRNPLELPVFPESAIATLKEAVRFSDGLDQRRIADLIATAQVVAARSRGRIATHAEIQLLIDFADLYERAGVLFEFGRISMDRHAISVNQIRHAFQIARIEEEDWPDLLTKMLEGREAARRRCQG